MCFQDLPTLQANRGRKTETVGICLDCVFAKEKNTLIRHDVQSDAVILQFILQSDCFAVY